MTSNYSSDPRVPPARVGHLGKHHKASPHGPVGLPAGNRRTDQTDTATPHVEQVRAEAVHAVDSGPTYADFLEGTNRSDELPGKTG